MYDSRSFMYDSHPFMYDSHYFFIIHFILCMIRNLLCKIHIILCMIHTILFYDSHCIVSSIIYLLTWNGSVQMPKRVVSLNKDNNIRQLCFDSKEPLFKSESVLLLILYTLMV